MSVQKKNLVNVLRRIANEIESLQEERLEAELLSMDVSLPRLVKFKMRFGEYYTLQLTYPDQED